MNWGARTTATLGLVISIGGTAAAGSYYASVSLVPIVGSQVLPYVIAIIGSWVCGLIGGFTLFFLSRQEG